jgi:hypothetical protein
LLELVRKLGKYVVFTRYLSTLSDVKEFLTSRNIDVIALSSMIDNFRKKDKTKLDQPIVMISTPIISGIGLNYHEGVSSIIFMEPLYIYKEYRQCIGRIDRINQKSDMYTHLE